jgi:manganese/zinc/iron transport system substrate-binding protein
MSEQVMKRRTVTLGWLLGAALVLPLLALAGCPGSDDNDPRPKVVCTTGMVADLVQRVGGDHVRVTQLMAAGVDPHLYETTPKDVQLLQKAKGIAYSGLHLEGQMGDVLGMQAQKKPTLAVAEKLDEKLLLGGKGGHDPHVWFDVELWASGITPVEEFLIALDPAHADDFRKNAAAYRKELADLDKWCKDEIATIPKDRRVLITAHDAFEYFGKAYDIEVLGIQGISTESEAGVARINELVDLIVRRGVRAVFVESSVSPKNMQALVEGCKARGHEVKVGGELFSDAMGQPGTDEGTYRGMIEHNVRTIVGALK